MALCLFAGLGFWQVQRLHWKHDLIARVDARIHATPVDMPSPDRLQNVDTTTFEYLRVEATGTYRAEASALVRAATELGTGYWAMTPMDTDQGETLWINRGFLPAGTGLSTARASVPLGKVTVIGLLRPSEPDGSLLQANRPADDRWYSRDVMALSDARAVQESVLPVFVDAQSERLTASAPARATPAGPKPVPGLTVVNFPDNHLGYAITWFALALMSAGAIVLVWRRAGRRAE
ncbi:SURF1 family protein [Novosphingobium aureum]|uniref:SURF1 family protein n=1 Tax=Novosphingobium aureum TaxID=2792964 RepID=UPI002B48B969|nr:SURF1 family protein [Novosphingobium aureum]